MERFPEIETILLEYIRELVDSGQPWYISRDLNSDAHSVEDYRTALAMRGMGQWAAIFAAVTAAAASVGTAALHALPAIAQTVGTLATMQHGSATQQGAAAAGIVLPANVATAAAATVNPATANANQNQLLIYAALGFGAILLLRQK